MLLSRLLCQGNGAETASSSYKLEHPQHPHNMKKPYRTIPRVQLPNSARDSVHAYDKVVSSRVVYSELLTPVPRDFETYEVLEKPNVSRQLGVTSPFKQSQVTPSGTVYGSLTSQSTVRVHVPMTPSKILAEDQDKDDQEEQEKYAYVVRTPQLLPTSLSPVYLTPRDSEYSAPMVPEKKPFVRNGLLPMTPDRPTVQVRRTVHAPRRLVSEKYFYTPMSLSSRSKAHILNTVRATAPK